MNNQQSSTNINLSECLSNESDILFNNCDRNASSRAITDHSWATWSLSLITILYVLVIICSVIGNGTVCYIVLAFRRMRTVTNYFIVNLAVSDLLMAVLCIPFAFPANVIYQYWPFGMAMCLLIPYLQASSIFLSSFTLVAIALDRYIAIIYPLRSKLTSKQAILIIASIWIISTGVSLPVAITSDLVQGMHNDSRVDYCDEKWPIKGQKYQYSISLMILQYFLPLFILTYTYVRICIIIWVKKPPGEADDERDRRMNASKRKMVKMMITVVVIYALCWLPVHSITLAGDADPDLYYKYGMNTVWVFCQWLSMSNSCYNPIVYWWMNKKYRAGFRHVYRCLPFCKTTPADKDTIYSGYNPPSSAATCVSSIRVTNSVRNQCANRSRVYRSPYSERSKTSFFQKDDTLPLRNIDTPKILIENVNGCKRAPSPDISD